MEMVKNKEALEYGFGRLLGGTAKAVKRFLNSKLEKSGSGLTPEQAIIIIEIWLEKGLNQQQLASFIGRDKTSTTRIIDSLENRGLVKRIMNRSDRRQNIIELTDEGEKIRIKILEQLKEFQESILEGIDPHKVEICEEVLNKIYQNISV